MPFSVLECPNVKLKKPSWLHMPSAMTVYAAVIVSYFLITGGIIYDVIVEPPSVGSMTDEHGHQRPVAFLAYRVNGQYIMEGLASSFLFTMGGPGLYNPGPLQRTKHSQTQPLPVALHRVCQRSAQLLHGQGVHAHEAARIPHGLKTRRDLGLDGQKTSNARGLNCNYG
ncbi:hypothetical protein CesoFtcFv8_026981 [Champsocephalus esox]|uniref:Oligosaccharyltransferase complex subunit n=1 Tax=Champsocephalus esox TaxID=159716 RepID=A0AAN8B0N5_9TELE|nr:hypothetical protein CesoFtcFv8_026981 [Champsocephalus esox]